MNKRVKNLYLSSPFIGTGDGKANSKMMNGIISSIIPLSSSTGYKSSTLQLSYTPDADNNIFSLNFLLKLLFIKQKIDKELPKYFDVIDLYFILLRQKILLLSRKKKFIEVSEKLVIPMYIVFQKQYYIPIKFKSEVKK